MNNLGEVMIDWTYILVAFFAAVPATVAALATLISSMRNSNKLTILGDNINGRVSQLIESIRSAAYAKGALAGKIQEQADELLRQREAERKLNPTKDSTEQEGDGVSP